MDLDNLVNVVPDYDDKKKFSPTEAQHFEYLLADFLGGGRKPL